MKFIPRGTSSINKMFKTKFLTNIQFIPLFVFDIQYFVIFILTNLSLLPNSFQLHVVKVLYI